MWKKLELQTSLCKQAHTEGEPIHAHKRKHACFDVYGTSYKHRAFPLADINNRNRGAREEGGRAVRSANIALSDHITGGGANAPDSRSPAVA